MLAKRRWAERHLDRLRRAIIHEPRGHADMYGAILTEPVDPTSQAGVLFMHREGFSTMCGHGVIAVATLGLEHGLLHVSVADSNDPVRLAFDTPAGTVSVWATRRGSRVHEVSFVNVPSFVLEAGVPVTASGRDLRVDVAFGGAFYAIVDSEAAGMSLLPHALPALRTLGLEIKEAVEARLTVAHPDQAGLKGIYGTIFTGLPHDQRADLRNVTVFADGQVDRSPCGSGTAAVMAVLDAMGWLALDRPFVHESIIGSTFRGSIAERTTIGERPAIRPRVEGSAWTTGFHEFVIDDDDPLADGFRV